MRVAHNKGERVPPGYLIDEQGQPTTDPGVVVVPQPNGLFGALMTFGEHKGYGMAVACELLGGALTGGGTWHRPADAARAVLNGMLTVLIDPARLGTAEALRQEAQAFVDWLRQSPPAPGHEGGVRIAGEPERAARRARRKRASRSTTRPGPKSSRRAKEGRRAAPAEAGPPLRRPKGSARQAGSRDARTAAG